MPLTPARTISIVVPAFNEEKLLAQTLADILRAAREFTARGWISELIVCDNNSTDRTAELARAAGARVVFEPFNQIGRARNRGAESAAGEWLLFIDADSRPEPALFADVAEAIERGDCLAGGSIIRPEAPTRMGRFGIRLWNFISCRTRSLAGSFIFCETAAFRRLGGFNLDLFASEELDLSRRLRKLARDSGKRIVVLCRHPLRTSTRKFELYTTGEYVRFIAITVLGFGRPLRSAKVCHLWYDGRR